jgi:hypothetical protein
MSLNKSPDLASRHNRGFLIFLGCLVLVLGFLFARSFQPGYVHFSNDGPLGVQKAAANQITDIVSGQWNDLYWIGFYGGSAPLNLNSAFTFLLGPVGFAKFLAPLSMLVLGLCAWVFFRQIKLSPTLCVVAGLAAALNSNFFSNVCWGLGSRALAAGMIFLALAAASNVSGRWGWIRLAVAGLAVGMSIMDAADNGAIFSLYVGAYVLFVALIEEGTGVTKVVKGILRASLVALFAALMATQVFLSVFSTQISGIQESQTPEQKWDFATQWSLPKSEILRVIIPGLFGYRVDRADGSQYWGNVGRQPGYEQHHSGFPRHSGSGEYAGILVVLIAFWALAFSVPAGGKTYNLRERRLIWFWGVMALISVLFAFGRYAGFYQFIYKLPYFSNIRNPIKFMHSFHISILILFGYGLMGLSRRYLESFSAKPLFLLEQIRSGWSKATSLEKRWSYAIGAFLAVSIFGRLVYSLSERSLQKFIGSPDFDARFANAPADALAKYVQGIIDFSQHEVTLYILFLVISAAALFLIMSGVFVGKRTRWAVVLIAGVLVVDLARADRPWLEFYNYEESYATNPVLDILRDKPWEHRVAIVASAGPYGDWLQHHFAYYNIQSLDMPQEPRVPADKVAYRQALSKNPARMWELTNTRYFLGGAGEFVEQMNQSLDPIQKRFRIVTAFVQTQAPVGSATLYQTNMTGPLALLEFTGALPRAKLYAKWQVNTNEQSTLQELASPVFDPGSTVLVSKGIPASINTNSTGGAVEIISYTPKRLTLHAESPASAVLLLNDKYDPSWKAFVDGQAVEVLKCNFLMQGLQVPAGTHEIEMRFEPPLKGLYVSLLALLIGLALCGILIFTRRSSSPQPNVVIPPTKPELQKH